MQLIGHQAIAKQVKSKPLNHIDKDSLERLIRSFWTPGSLISEKLSKLNDQGGQHCSQQAA